MKKSILTAAALFGMTAVIFGAFGAHALKKVLDVSQLATFETGVRYQMYHAFLLLFIGLYDDMSVKRRKVATILVCIGIVLFSGSIYLLATDSLNAFDFKVIGFVTPVGGALLIVAWLVLLIEFVGKKS